MKNKFFGKTLVIESEDERVLVIGDLHLGFDESLRTSGVMIPTGAFNQSIKDLKDVLEKLEDISKVILLGDIKHAFHSILRDEWKEILEFIDILRNRSSEVIIIKGNHDAIIEPVAKARNIEVTSCYLWKGYAFVHGDKDNESLHDKSVHTWIMGHAHPAITLSDGTKQETYKCFLIGKYKGKNVIIVPSFFTGHYGSDVRTFSPDLAWKFNLLEFEVYVVENINNVLKFGKLKEIV